MILFQVVATDFSKSGTTWGCKDINFYEIYKKTTAFHPALQLWEGSCSTIKILAQFKFQHCKDMANTPNYLIFGLF